MIVGRRSSRESVSYRQAILELLDAHPEGLNTQEMNKYFNGRVNSHLQYLKSKNAIGIVKNDLDWNTYIPISEVPYETPVEIFIREKDLNRVGSTRNIVYKMKTSDILLSLEACPEGATPRELAEIMGVDIESGEYRRLRSQIMKYTGSLLVRGPRKGGSKGEFIYRVGRVDSDMEDRLKKRKTPIGYIYEGYDRCDIHLREGGIPVKVVEDLVRCIEHTEVVKNITPKCINMRIRFLDINGDAEYIITITNEEYTIIYSLEDRRSVSGAELLEFLKSRSECKEEIK